MTILDGTSIELLRTVSRRAAGLDASCASWCGLSLLECFCGQIGRTGLEFSETVFSRNHGAVGGDHDRGAGRSPARTSSLQLALLTSTTLALISSASRRTFNNAKTRRGASGVVWRRGKAGEIAVSPAAGHAPPYALSTLNLIDLSAHTSSVSSNDPPRPTNGRPMGSPRPQRVHAVAVKEERASVPEARSKGTTEYDVSAGCTPKQHPSPAPRKGPSSAATATVKNS